VENPGKSRSCTISCGKAGKSMWIKSFEIAVLKTSGLNKGIGKYWLLKGVVAFGKLLLEAVDFA